MEDNHHRNKQRPILPPNYVTLLQLQERWIKEQNQKHKQEEEDQHRLQHPPPVQNEDRGHRNPTPTEEPRALAALTVAGAGKSEENGNDRKDGRKKKKKKNKKNNNKEEEEQKTTSEKVEEVKEVLVESEGHARVVESEKADVVAVRRRRKKWRGKGAVVEYYRPKVGDNAAKEGDRTVEIESKMNPAAEASDWSVEVVNSVGESDRRVKIEGQGKDSGRTVVKIEGKESDRTVKIEMKTVDAVEEEGYGNVEIERKFGEISFEEEKGGVEKQPKFIRGGNYTYGGHDGVVKRGYAMNVGGGGGGHGRHYGGSVRSRGRGGYGWAVHGGEQRGIRDGMVWVKKEVPAGGSVKQQLE